MLIRIIADVLLLIGAVFALAGTIGILKPGAPGLNLIFRGDDVYPGKAILKAGRVLTPQDIGALAAVGKTMVPVARKLRVGVISTGDELVPPDETPESGQVRDVNTPVLTAMLRDFGAEPVGYGIVADDEALLRRRGTVACEMKGERRVEPEEDPWKD